MKNTLIAILLLCSTAICAQTNKDFQEIDNYFKAIRTAPESIDIDKMESFVENISEPLPESEEITQLKIHYLKGYIKLIKHRNAYEAREHIEKYLELYYKSGIDFGVLGTPYTKEMRQFAQLFQSHDCIYEAIMYANRAIIINSTIAWTRDTDSTYLNELSQIASIASQLYATMQSRTKGATSENWGKIAQEHSEYAKNIIKSSPHTIDKDTRKKISTVGKYQYYFSPSYSSTNEDSLSFTFAEAAYADRLLLEIERDILLGKIRKGETAINKIYNKALEAIELYKRMLPYKYDEYFNTCRHLLSAATHNGKAAEAYSLITSWDEKFIHPKRHQVMNLQSYRSFIRAYINTLLAIGREKEAHDYYYPLYHWLCEEKLDFSEHYLLSRYKYHKHSNYNNEFQNIIYCLTLNDLAYWRNCNIAFNSIYTQEYDTYTGVGLPLFDYLKIDSPEYTEYIRVLHLSQLYTYCIKNKQHIEAQGHLEKIVNTFNSRLQGRFTSEVPIKVQTFLGFLQYCNNDNKYLRTINQSYIKTTNLIKESFLTLPAEDRKNIHNKYKLVFDVNNALLWYNKSNKAAEHLYNSALFSKGLQLRTSTLIQDAILSSGDTAIINRYNEINYLNSLHNNDAQMKMELNLLQKVPFDKTFDEKMQKKWTEVKELLKEDEVAIEFMRIPHWKNIEELISNTEPLADYCALLLRNNSKHPEIIPLCSEDYLQSLLTRKVFKDAIHYNNIYSNNKKRDCRGDELYNALWAPIEKHLQGVSTIYYSTDGVLHSLALHAMHDSAKVCLSDRYAMNLLSSTGDIQEFKSRKSRKPASAVVYGGAHFSVENGDELVAATEKYNIRQQGDGLFAELQRSDNEGSWPYLPGTLVEAEYVKKKMDSIKVPARLLTGVEANEESFKAMDRNAPQLLHVATHGFYISTQESDQISNFMDFLASAHNLDSVADAQSRSDAMLRSGLIFAGGNRAWSNREAIDGVEDGILTSAEISSLNLSSTKLLVLAACQSGLGEANDHEGVFGLQRAFKLAGVETIIMTLWRVPDDTTAKLIQLFYDNWTAGMEKHAAFKKAQQQIRAENPNPYYWGAFVILD